MLQLWLPGYGVATLRCWLPSKTTHSSTLKISGGQLPYAWITNLFSPLYLDVRRPNDQAPSPLHSIQLFKFGAAENAGTMYEKTLASSLKSLKMSSRSRSSPLLALE